MTDIMVDLETMGNGPNAAIVAIGAVAMNFETGELGEGFYKVVDLESSISHGGVVDAGTVIWWLKQSDEARAMFLEPGEKIVQALKLFTLYLTGFETKHNNIWGNGATFDNVVLSSAYRNAGLTRPWSYAGDRCYRTIKNLYPEIPMESVGVKHNALDDAKAQALHLMKMLKK